MWSIHENRTNGNRAIVIANEDATRETTATVTLDDQPTARFRAHTVDDLDGTDLPAANTVTIPARSVVVLVEN
jgi:hypothetical protein